MAEDNIEQTNEEIKVASDAQPTEIKNEETAQAENIAETPSKEESVKSDVIAEEQEDWRAKELRRKHAQIKDRDRELERIRKENEDLRVLAERSIQNHQSGSNEPQPNTIPQYQRQQQDNNLTQSQIFEAARQLRDQEKYQENIINTNNAGEKAYGKDWGAALNNLATLTDEIDISVMRSIMATDAPEKVIYELGKNPSEYQRVMELPPERRQVEFVKLSLKQDASKPKPSSAPAPTESLSPRVQPTMDLSDKDDDATWYKKRAAQREVRRKERMRA